MIEAVSVDKEILNVTNLEIKQRWEKLSIDLVEIVR